jgi:hypothetical protein
MVDSAVAAGRHGVLPSLPRARKIIEPVISRDGSVTDVLRLGKEAKAVSCPETPRSALAELSKVNQRYRAARPARSG